MAQVEHTYYSLTHAQKRIWYTEQFYPGTSLSNLGGFGKLKSTSIIDRDILVKAIDEVVRANEALRLQLVVDDEGEPRQYVSGYQPFHIQEFDLTSSGDTQQALSWGKTEIKRFMELYNSPLYRFAVFHLSDTESWFFVKLHHVIVDGISVVLVVNQIIDTYLELLTGTKERFDTESSYVEYIRAEDEYVRSKRFQRDQAYWTEKFDSVPDAVSLKRVDSRRVSTRAARLSKVIPNATGFRIRQFCEEHKISELALFLALLDIYLYRVTGQSDVVVGTFVGNRTNAKEKQMLGMFVSTIPVRTYVDGDTDFLTFVRQKTRDQTATIRHQKYPYAMLVDDLRKKHGNFDRLFAVSLEFQVMQWFETEQGLSYLADPLFNGHEVNDISIHLKERWDTGTLDMDLDYRIEVFSRDEVETFYQSILTLLENALDDPMRQLSDLGICSEEDKEDLLSEYRRPRVSLPDFFTLQSLFGEQAAKTPEQTAVRYEGNKLSYSDLNRRANRLGRVLRDKGVGPNTRVAICMSRSADLIIAIMGVLKSGGAYVPIDPDLPEERIRFMIRDSGAKAVVTEQHFVSKCDVHPMEVLLLNQMSFMDLNDDNLSDIADTDDMAYMIYTSGTTGKPKGVKIEHRQVQHLIAALDNHVYSAYETPLNVALVAPSHFDASVQQIFAALVLGHTLCIASRDDVRDGQKLADFYSLHQIDVTDGTPAHLQMLQGAHSLRGVRLLHMLIGGEALRYETLREVRALFNEYGLAPIITNVYGPTECCVDVSAFDVLPTEGSLNSDMTHVPIGKPLGNHRLYILDACCNFVPTGVQGELYIAGDGVGAGYWDLPELTSEKFLADPFVPRDKMYKTGDLARRLPDGNIAFLGRIDDQVKIRGYRIELGEIEAVLETHVDVRKAVVLSREHDEIGADLWAYVVCQGTADAASLQQLRMYLSNELPNYMVPTYFVRLEEVPLTHSGKVDRKALAECDADVVRKTDYVAPTNELERELAVIWQDVLDAERVGLYDHFFELGGHSLKAIKLLSHVHKNFGVEVPLPVLFETPTVHAMAKYISDADYHAFETIEPALKRELYPLSFAQRQIYITCQFDARAIGYNMPAAIRFDGPLDLNRLQSAFCGIIERHEALRTSFVTVDGVPYQRVHDDVVFEMELTEGAEEHLESSMASFVHPFDLGSAPLMRAEMMRLERDKHVLLFDMHHLVADGTSIGIILNDLAHLYAGNDLPLPRLQYRDFATWQVEQGLATYKAAEDYWLEKMSGELPSLQLLTDYSRPSVQSFRGDRVSLTLDKALQGKLNRLAESNGTTMYVVLLTAYFVLLHRYTGQTDILVGTPVAGRNHANTEDIVGMFVNTLAIRSEIVEPETFFDLLQSVANQAVGALEHQNYPFEWLVDKLHLPRDLSRHPLFDTMFSFQNAYDELPALGEARMSVHDTNFQIAKFDLTLQANEQRDGIYVDLDYNTALFRGDTARRMLGHYENILAAIVADTYTKVGEIILLSDVERRRLLADFNPPATDYPKDKSLADLFEEQASRSPDKVALVFEDETLTYAQLNARANQLARVLQGKGIENGAVVALLVNRSLEMVIGILAILKLGAAYVTLDPEHPRHRIKFVLSDSGTSAVLTQKVFTEVVDDLDGSFNCVFVDDKDNYHGDTGNLHVSIQSNNLANLTYTSGTTGTPKGNMVTHANIVRTVKCTNYLSILDEDVVLCISNYVFDAFMFDLFGTLLNGAKLVIAPRHVILQITELSRVIERERITILMITTALFNLLIDIHPNSLKAVRKLLFGGERASVPHVRKALAVLGKGKLLHMYGPSESTVFATYYPVDEVAVGADSIPIGKAVSNTAAYVLNSMNQLQPIGAAGELCVGGDGLVLGYANRAEMTAEKFVDHPLEKGQRMFRTGDLVRQLADGNIEFIGRIDKQVKIRGQRIELGEIEHQLVMHRFVREAAVLAVTSESGDKELCAYVVLDRPLSDNELRKHLEEQLPMYMVPSVYIKMDNLPLTGNGKVNRKALPKPDSTQLSVAEYVAPRNEIETELADLWQQTLGVERVSVRDNFFHLGGHSLMAMRLIANIHQLFGVELTLRDLFQSPTVEELARLVADTEVSPYSSIEVAPKAEDYPLSFAQKRVYVISQLEGAQTSYNMPAAMRVSGRLDKERFAATIKSIVMRHEALRTSFDVVDGDIVQRVHDEVCMEVAYWKATEDEVEGRIAEFVRPFTLREAPLMRVGLIRLSEEHHILLFDMHHIISDGVSVRVLMDEIAHLYSGNELHAPRIQYKDYAVWQQSFCQSPAYRQQEVYWLEEFAGELPVLDLPTDYTRPAMQTFAGDRVDFSLNPELTQVLKQLAESTGTTLYMVLLACFGVFISKLSGQEDIVVGSPIAGRPHADLMNIVGMFVNTLAIRTSPERHKTFVSYLGEVKEKSLAASESADYPFEELVQNIEVQRDMSRNPLFDALFVLQNTDVGELEMEGVRLEPYDIPFETAKFDLSLAAREYESQISFSMEYNTALFEAKTIRFWVKHFVTLLEQVAVSPDELIMDINLLTRADERRLLTTFDDSSVSYPRDKTIHQLFEEQVDGAPDRVALVVDNQRITYWALNGRANRLARFLREKGVHAGDLIGVMVDNSLDMVVSNLAVLKAGGAYVPIDPNYPEDRVRYFVEDSGLNLVLTTRSFAGRLSIVELQLLDGIDDESYESTNLACVNDANSLAYVMYTSGSTGKPKGVMVEHRNVVRLVKNRRYVPLDDACRMAQTGAMSFDATTFEMFGALLNGGALYPVPRDVLLDADRMRAFLSEHRVTTMWLTSPLFNQLAQEKADMFKTLEHLMVGGDALSPQHINRIRHACPQLSLWNGYGPTENTTFSTCFPIHADYVDRIPIGKPIEHSTAYILDADGRPQPIGVPGELCVGGDGVARGYLNRPELTEEKFVPDPFRPQARMYRTGDLARWLPDGNIDFLGRIDRQVKIRGYRIELGEIESQLTRLEGVFDAIVVQVQSAAGENELCAYVVCDKEVTSFILRETLSESLPAYMLPSYFMQLDEMPLTQNGKVDRKSLPKPGLTDNTEEYKAPRNESEMILSTVWQEILGAEQIGIHDNFFSLGGDSIKAIQVAAQLNKRGWKLEMKDLFQHPTIEQVAVYLRSVQEQMPSQTAVEGEVGLTPIQQWFFERNFSEMHHWNQSLMLYAPEALEPTFVGHALEKLVEHHDALRMTYSVLPGRVVQYNHSVNDVEVDFRTITLDTPAGELERVIEHEANNVHASIRLSDGPLFKAVLFKTQNGDHLLIVIHHLVVDGVSWRILVEDFVSGYLQAQRDESIVLPDKTHSFLEWSEQLLAYANSNQCLREVDYWNQVQNVKPVTLPKDFETEDYRMKHTQTATFSLTRRETEELTTRTHLTYRTEMNDILLAALGYALQDWTGADEIPVLLEGHGREEILENVNISRTVGWFTTQYPVVLNMTHSSDLAYQVKYVKEDLRHIPNKGIGYGLLRYLTNTNKISEQSFSLRPDISFNYLGQFDGSLSAKWLERSPFASGDPQSGETDKMSAIDIVGFIEDGIFTITLAYNSKEYAHETVQRLTDAFKMHLLRVVNHCLQQQNSAITPSDVGDDELTLEELDTLLETL